MPSDEARASGAFAGREAPWQTASMRLAELRKSRGLSQRQLGEMIGKDAATISRAENGHGSAMLQTYADCAAALGVPLMALFGDDVSPIEKRLLDVFRSLPAERQAEMVALLEIAKGPPDQAG